MWVKLDDAFYDHPKVEDLSLEAIGLWTLCASYCGKHLTDGFISAQRVKRFGGEDSAVEELLHSGLWVMADKGYQFHDWSEYQPTKSQVESKRESDRDRKRKQRRTPSGTYAESQDDSVGRHAVTPNGLPAESRGESHRPDPTRPDPTPSVPSRRKPERPLPKSWAPNSAHSDYAQTNGINLDFQAERFRNHAQANDRRARDWNAAFRNWLLKAEPSKTASKNPLWDA